MSARPNADVERLVIVLLGDVLSALRDGLAGEGLDDAAQVVVDAVDRCDTWLEERQS